MNDWMTEYQRHEWTKKMGNIEWRKKLRKLCGFDLNIWDLLVCLSVHTLIRSSSFPSVCVCLSDWHSDYCGPSRIIVCMEWLNMNVDLTVESVQEAFCRLGQRKWFSLTTMYSSGSFFVFVAVRCLYGWGITFWHWIQYKTMQFSG